eukprot:COSAG02_NODE_7685_length_2895_cov_3.989628_4_plen_99_part_00
MQDTLGEEQGEMIGINIVYIECAFFTWSGFLAHLCGIMTKTTVGLLLLLGLAGRALSRRLLATDCIGSAGAGRSSALVRSLPSPLARGWGAHSRIFPS